MERRAQNLSMTSPSEWTQLPLPSPQKLNSRRPIRRSPPQPPRRTKRRRRFCWPRCAARPRVRRAVRHQNIALAAQTGRGKRDASAMRATPTVCRNTSTSARGWLERLRPSALSCEAETETLSIVQTKAIPQLEQTVFELHPKLGASSASPIFQETKKRPTRTDWPRLGGRKWP